MKFNWKKFSKKEKAWEDKTNQEITDFEEKVNSNSKYWWFLSILVALGVAAVFLILHFVSGVA